MVEIMGSARLMRITTAYQLTQQEGDSDRLRTHLTNQLKIKGGTTHAISTTVNIPTIVTSANEWRAGCFATMSEPIPINMIRAEITMLFLYEGSNFFR